MSGAADVQAAFCAVVCEEWARCGVTDAVVAPGSRSTPMVLALDREPRIQVHLVLDERVAGFLALGLAVASRRPAVVVTTSGTASVELHPAVVEASQGGVPLIAVTTDRPPELHHVGAPQTVEQHALFGPAPRWSVDPGVAELAASGSWRSLACRCVAEAEGWRGTPGPVHVNLPFREPLLGAAGAVEPPPGRPDGRPWHRAARGAGRPDRVALDDVAAVLGEAAGGAGLIVAGEGAGEPAAVARLADRLGWPVLADARSGLRVPGLPVVAAADILLRSEPVSGWTPEAVLRLGAPWASKVLAQWLARLDPAVPQVFLDRAGRWSDPDRTASHVVAAGADDLVAALVDRPPPRREAGRWMGQWLDAEAAAQQVLAEMLGPGGELEGSEPAVARACLAALPEGGLLVTSSSMPVRDVEWFGAARAGARVLANRGANGIDGVVSTAIGAALAGGQPTVCLIGDLAFLYDAGALLWAAGRRIHLSVVVVDNDGGGIFSFLPQAAALEPDRFERYWGTPHGTDLVTLAGAYGVAAERLDGRPELDRFLGRAEEPGLRVGVVGSDREFNVKAHDRLNAAVGAAVAARSGRD